ncbi:hypothetical protein OU426_04985 [Frigidibacter sp. RF13]|uniref:hypothetical protein n=1 Tax=Frigidibacter sp. RF13 TaxID=2997340 RepID=UPI0022718B86|nr:hypothetical protein [Frigidibacter sp. RF13]MCY1126202.1 hypothetical protein [Frigidibacter sp. RF13]
MDHLLTIALWLHLAAIGLGGSATFGIPVVGAVASLAPPEARPHLALVGIKLSLMGRTALGILIATGLLLVWGHYGLDGLRGWFWVKMVLVALFTGLVIFSVKNGAKARAGDVAAAARAPLLGLAGIGLFLLIVLSAVLTFL